MKLTVVLEAILCHAIHNTQWQLINLPMKDFDTENVEDRNVE